jgi:pseudouridine-5'-phosphate glycosidase
MQSIQTLKNLISISEEVSKAINNNIPIVALESTIITHGMPFPENLKMAIEAEQTVRQNNCVPATIAVIDGKIKIGLRKTEIENLASSKNILKLSTSDLAICISQNGSGSTTVAATLVLASLANISVFATGGIGGAHRGSETTFDVSADLKQLSISPITVVCAGPKAMLDIPKTVEILETLGVPLITYRSKNIPAFWSFDSGILSPLVINSVEEIAINHKMRLTLGFSGGQLICNPIPKIEEISNKIIDPIIKQAVEGAFLEKITGKQLTPFLLSSILSITKGKSLQANRALLLNNILLASQIAKKLNN